MTTTGQLPRIGPSRSRRPIELPPRRSAAHSCDSRTSVRRRAERQRAELSSSIFGTSSGQTRQDPVRDVATPLRSFTADPCRVVRAAQLLSLRSRSLTLELRDVSRANETRRPQTSRRVRRQQRVSSLIVDHRAIHMTRPARRRCILRTSSDLAVSIAATGTATQDGPVMLPPSSNASRSRTCLARWLRYHSQRQEASHAAVRRRGHLVDLRHHAPRQRRERAAVRPRADLDSVPADPRRDRGPRGAGGRRRRRVVQLVAQEALSVEGLGCAARTRRTRSRTSARNSKTNRPARS